MSVAKHLMMGRILEEQLFPYPKLRDKDREVLGMMVDAIDQFLSPKRRDFKRSDEIRQQLLDSGILVEDTKDGSVRWKYK